MAGERREMAGERREMARERREMAGEKREMTARKRKDRERARELSSGGRVWRVAAYIRLSREDGNDESLSVTNQKKIIAGYLEEGAAGRYILAGFYIDDGETGTDHDRPAFGRMIRDMEEGRIDCIICKNLSRMFRNYADQGYFLEKVFPKHRTRFITVSEPKIDSYLHPEALFGLEVPINGLMNDRFAAKTSRDIRETFAAKRKRGEFIGAFAPYGYKRSPEDKNKLCVDREAAEVVRDIYDWYVLEGMSKNGIARRLNELGVPSPAAYKRSKGLRFYCPQMEKSGGLWSPRAVALILKNQVYTGAMVQGRQTVISYKVHEKVAVPEEDWYVVPGMHEPIIQEALFQRAAQLQKADTRTAPGERKRHLLSGLIYCADCKRAMTRQKTKGIVYYYCRTYRERSRTSCTKHTIREDVVLKAVAAAIRERLALSQPASDSSVQSQPAGDSSARPWPIGDSSAWPWPIGDSSARPWPIGDGSAREDGGGRRSRDEGMGADEKTGGTAKIGTVEKTGQVKGMGKTEAGAAACAKQQGGSKGVTLAALYRGKPSRQEREASRLEELFLQRQKELEKITKILDELYGDWKDGLITKEGYIRLREKYFARAGQLEHAVETIRAQRKKMGGDPSREDAGDGLKGGRKGGRKGGTKEDGEEDKKGDPDQDMEVLDRGLLVSLIQGIYVHEGGQITIRTIPQ